MSISAQVRCLNCDLCHVRESPWRRVLCVFNFNEFGYVPNTGSAPVRLRVHVCRCIYAGVSDVAVLLGDQFDIVFVLKV